MKDFKVNPTRILVKDIIEEEKVTKTGILLPSAVIKAPTMKGKIITRGEGTNDIKIVFNIGETVLFSPHAGNKLTFEEQEYRLIDVADVLLGGVR
jgi:co-chaperonin GroES (HSP10)